MTKNIVRRTLALCCYGFFTLICSKSFSAEHYLPTNLDPALEAKIERLMVSANMPIILRPIPISQVEAALEKTGKDDPLLSKSVENFLKRYKRKVGIVHAQLKLSASSGSNALRSNERGTESKSSYQASGSAFFQFHEFAILNVGAYAYESSLEQKDEFLENSYLSLGNHYFQVDIGTRAHWFGPFQESDMLLSTNASALPGVTFSNAKPLTFLGIRYEIFMAQMSESNSILSEDRSERLSGNPRLFGFHTSFEPLPGFAVGFNRLMQYGGADRDESFSSLMKAFFNAKEYDNIGLAGKDFGNQVSSVTTRFTFPGTFPLSLYMEYAGEDSSLTSSAHLGNSSLMLGFHAPRLTDTLDFTYEFAEWQNAWYVNTNYGDGLRQHHTILGHWGANHRVFSNAVGASTHMAKLNWYIDERKTLISKFRQIENQNYSQIQYKTGRALELEYNQRFEHFTLGLAALAGKDVFGENYTQATGIFRW
ncbi:Capsule assembly protein Wzi [Alteromonadaceae bacterium Bs31]|nr:Capsule assembly protein Wzi [Alteromonadaceae bacterium Bs31]